MNLRYLPGSTLALARASALALSLALSFTPSSAMAQRYDATKSFTTSTRTNPNGVWSYGYLEAGTLNLKVFPDFVDEGWRIGFYDLGHLQLEAPIFWKNIGTDVVAGVLPGQLSLHPGWVSMSSPFDDAALIRFTAPVSGKYAVSLSLFKGNTGETEAWVLKNLHFAMPLAHFPSTTVDPTWKHAVPLSQGETIEVVVGHSNDSFYSDDTPLALVIRKK